MQLLLPIYERICTALLLNSKDSMLALLDVTASLPDSRANVPCQSTTIKPENGV